MSPTLESSLAPVSPAERDLQTAGQLQRMLLPPSPFAASGWTAVHTYEPAGVVSGDYLDLVPYGDRVHFMLGDVSGKGVSAALLMAQLHAMFRTLIPVQLPLDELLARASSLLCASSLPAQYATLVTGYLAADGHVALGNAGHLPPLIVGDSGQRTVQATGVPIGMFCQSDFSATQLSLGRNETLLMYTDGLSEGRNPSGEEYGVRVADVAHRAARSGLSDILKAVVSDQAQFRGDSPNTADMTVLAIRRC
jgi:sigma-B regulation protein RsbU (phosphoserine phosphatase)